MLRKSVFTEKIGPEFLDIAFHTAREADGKALLTLNEYGTEYNIPDHLRKRRELLKLIDGFRDELIFVYVPPAELARYTL